MKIKNLKVINHKCLTVSLTILLLLNSTGSVANILFGTELFEYSSISGAGLTINADAVISANLTAVQALSIGARVETGNLYAGNAVDIGAASIVGNVYSGHATNVQAGAVARTINSGAATNIENLATVGDIYSMQAVTLTGLAEAQDIYSGTNVTITAAGGKALDVYAAGAINSMGTTTSITEDPTVKDLVSEQVTNAANEGSILDLLKVINDEQEYLNTTFNGKIGNTVLQTNIAADFTYTFLPGVYEGTALTTGAGATIIFDGSGVNNPFWLFNMTETLTLGANNFFEVRGVNKDTDTAQVIWNTEAAISIGADTGIIGTTLSKSAATGGAGSFVKCGNLFSLAAVTITGVQSSDCLGVVTSSPPPPVVPEPTALAILALGLMGLILRSRRKV
jgi:hypothetical protein